MKWIRWPASGRVIEPWSWIHFVRDGHRVRARAGTSGPAGHRSLLPRASPPDRRTAGRAACGSRRSGRAARSCVPCSTIWPRTRTTMRSALRMVDRRCAMTSVVRPCISVSSACWTRRSDSLSSAEVASSSTRMRRVLEQRARDRQALALAAGEAQAELADHGVVAVRQLHDELVRVGRSWRRR